MPSKKKSRKKSDAQTPVNREGSLTQSGGAAHGANASTNSLDDTVTTDLLKRLINLPSMNFLESEAKTY